MLHCTHQLPAEQQVELFFCNRSFQPVVDSAMHIVIGKNIIKFKSNNTYIFFDIVFKVRNRIRDSLLELIQTFLHEIQLLSHLNILLLLAVCIRSLT